jgi:hypothetical protein
MPTVKAQGSFDCGQLGFELTTRRTHLTVPAHDEAAIELGQLLHGFSQVRSLD